MIEAVLAAAVMIYGVVGALASLLQLRRIRERGSSEDVSLASLSVYGGGYALWLAYGVVMHSTPLIVADAVGAAAMIVTIRFAARLRAGPHCASLVRAQLRSGTGGSAGADVPLAEAIPAPAIQRSAPPEARCDVSARRGSGRWSSRPRNSLTGPLMARATRNSRVP